MRTSLTAILILLAIPLYAQEEDWKEKIDSALVESAMKRASVASLPIFSDDLKRTASPLGEADPVKFIQTLPGVSTGMEGSSAYYVRGGNGGNNITTLDGVPVYGSGHLLGLTTSYPFDIVSSSEFYAGGFPSDLEGFTSSLLQLNTRDGNFIKPEGSVSINNFLVGGQISAPIKKGKSSVLASLRFSPLGWEYNLIRPLISSELQIPDKIRSLVGDAFVKMTWNAGARGRFYVSIFGSYDGYGYDPDENTEHDLRWSNLIVNLTWNRKSESGWSIEGKATHNHFGSSQRQIQGRASDNSTKMFLSSALSEEGLHLKASRTYDSGIDFTTGSDIYLSFFSPGVSKTYRSNEISAKAGSTLPTVRGSLHFQTNYGKGPLFIGAGLRGTVYMSEEYKTVKPVVNLTASYKLSRSLCAKATYDHTVQFMHTLEGIPTGWSMEMLTPSTEHNGPESADQAWAGLDFSAGRFGFSAGGFYKKMEGIVFYSDASSFFNSAWREWTGNLKSGSGKSFGLEILSTFKTERLSGQLSYTLSKTDRVFEDINCGSPIPFKFDRRHVLNLTGEYKLSANDNFFHGITMGLSLQSGHWESVKSGSYPTYSLGPDCLRETTMADFTLRPNNYQLPYYFRLDSGYHFSVKRARTCHNLSIGVYNLTNRHNVCSLIWDSESSSWKALSIFPILPNFTYKVSF